MIKIGGAQQFLPADHSDTSDVVKCDFGFLKDNTLKRQIVFVFLIFVWDNCELCSFLKV
jgi:hypothetical protein